MNKIVDRLQGLDAANIPLSKLLDWLRIAVEIERKSRGVPDRREVTGEGGGAIPVRLSLQETLEKICEFYNLDPKLAKPQERNPRIVVDFERGSELGDLRTYVSMNK